MVSNHLVRHPLGLLCNESLESVCVHRTTQTQETIWVSGGGSAKVVCNFVNKGIGFSFCCACVTNSLTAKNGHSDPSHQEGVLNLITTGHCLNTATLHFHSLPMFFLETPWTSTIGQFIRKTLSLNTYLVLNILLENLLLESLNGFLL